MIIGLYMSIPCLWICSAVQAFESQLPPLHLSKKLGHTVHLRKHNKYINVQSNMQLGSVV